MEWRACVHLHHAGALTDPRDTDKELANLTQYLLLIGEMDDLSRLKHRHWERLLQKEGVDLQ